MLFSSLMGGMALGQAAPSVPYFINGAAAGGKIFKVLDRTPKILQEKRGAMLKKVFGIVVSVSGKGGAGGGWAWLGSGARWWGGIGVAWTLVMSTTSNVHMPVAPTICPCKQRMQSFCQSSHHVLCLC